MVAGEMFRIARSLITCPTRLFKYLFFAVLLLSGGLSLAQEVPSCSKILDYVDNQLPHCGVLKNSQRFVYVAVDNDYIHKLVTFINEAGFEEPPYFGDLVGAHLSVIYPDEVKNYGIGAIEECGEIIYFTPQGCKIVPPETMQGVEAMYVIVVEAPQLDWIRKKYGLPQKKYPFHITIGVKPTVAQAAA